MCGLLVSHSWQQGSSATVDSYCRVAPTSWPLKVRACRAQSSVNHAILLGTCHLVCPASNITNNTNIWDSSWAQNQRADSWWVQCGYCLSSKSKVTKRRKGRKEDKDKEGPKHTFCNLLACLVVFMEVAPDNNHLSNILQARSLVGKATTMDYNETFLHIEKAHWDLINSKLPRPHSRSMVENLGQHVGNVLNALER